MGLKWIHENPARWDAHATWGDAEVLLAVEPEAQKRDGKVLRRVVGAAKTP